MWLYQIASPKCTNLEVKIVYFWRLRWLTTLKLQRSLFGLGKSLREYTFPETNIANGNSKLEDETSFEDGLDSTGYVSFLEAKLYTTVDTVV